jgi:hypothetical protein
LLKITRFHDDHPWTPRHTLHICRRHYIHYHSRVDRAAPLSTAQVPSESTVIIVEPSSNMHSLTVGAISTPPFFLGVPNSPPFLNPYTSVIHFVPVVHPPLGRRPVILYALSLICAWIRHTKRSERDTRVDLEHEAAQALA